MFNTSLHRSRMVSWAAIVAVVATTFLAIAIPAAHAASWKYADAWSTPEGQPRYSGVRPSVTGGQVSVGLGVGTQTIITYYGAPGYDEVGYAHGAAPNSVALFHERYYNASSKCFFQYHNIGGNADLNCWVYW